MNEGTVHAAHAGLLRDRAHTILCPHTAFSAAAELGRVAAVLGQPFPYVAFYVTLERGGLVSSRVLPVGSRQHGARRHRWLVDRVILHERRLSSDGSTHRSSPVGRSGCSSVNERPRVVVTRVGHTEGAGVDPPGFKKRR